jgi:hypothetical protein
MKEILHHAIISRLPAGGGDLAVDLLYFAIAD